MEKAVEFYCNQTKLYGILHLPEPRKFKTSVTIVTGGPQTRVGSHRLNVQLARYLCRQGLIVLRFDYTGMGDSGGDPVGYQLAAPSIRSAHEFVLSTCPEIKQNILWSICDGCLPTLAALNNLKIEFAGLILCNPFIFNESERSRLKLRYYYGKRLLKSKTWTKLISIKIKFKKEIFLISKNLLGLMQFMKSLNYYNPIKNPRSLDTFLSQLLINNTPIHFILSSQDDIAMALFDILDSDNMKNLFDDFPISYQKILDGDHTFANRIARGTMFINTIKTIESFCSNSKGLPQLFKLGSEQKPLDYNLN